MYARVYTSMTIGYATRYDTNTYKLYMLYTIRYYYIYSIRLYKYKYIIYIIYTVIVITQ